MTTALSGLARALPLIVIYPLLFRDGNTLAGLWAIYASLPGLAGAFTGGLSLDIWREAGHGARLSRLICLAQDLMLLRTLWTVFCGVLAVIALWIGPAILSQMQPLYPPEGLALSAAALLVGLAIWFSAEMGGAVLTAGFDAAVVPVLRTCARLIYLAIMVTGILVGTPIEAIGLGWLCSMVIYTALVAWRIHTRHRRWRVAVRAGRKVSPDPVHAGSRLVGLLPGYALMIAINLRAPALLWAVGAAGGLGVVAIVDIAMRIAVFYRSIVSGTVTPLLTGFAAAARADARQTGVAHQGHTSSLDITSRQVETAGIAFAILTGIAGVICVPLWMPTLPTLFAPVFAVILFGMGAQSLSLSATHFLLSRQQEGVLAGLVWTHIVITGLTGLIPLAPAAATWLLPAIWSAGLLVQVVVTRALARRWGGSPTRRPWLNLAALAMLAAAMAVSPFVAGMAGAVAITLLAVIEPAVRHLPWVIARRLFGKTSA